MPTSPTEAAPTGATSPPSGSSASASKPGSGPAAWGDVAALSTDAPRPGTRAPLPTGLLEAGRGTDRFRVDLSGIWAPLADPSAPASNLELRRICEGLRLIVPLEPMGDVTLRAQRDGQVLTIFLPDSAEAPSPGRAVAPLKLRSKGRLTLGKNLCAELGIGAGWTMLVLLDPDRRLVTLAPASALQGDIAASVQRLLPSPPGTSGRAAA